MTPPDDSVTPVVSWDEPATRAAWVKLFIFAILGQILWPVTSIGSFILMILIGKWSMWFMLPISVYALYRAGVQRQDIASAIKVRRVLRAYPWQLLEGVPSGLGKYPGARDDGIWFEFRNPGDPDEKIPLVFIHHHRSYWWLKRMDSPRVDPRRRAEIEPLWFAGDPRFLAVVAASGRKGKAPKRLHLLYQRPVFDSRFVPESWGAGVADIERARRAGARRLDVIPQPEPSEHERTQQGEESGSPVGTPQPALPWASQPAIHHPPTRRAMRWRLLRQAVLLFVVWPALVGFPVVQVVSGNEDSFPVVMRILIAALLLLPFNIWVAVSALRTHRRLSAHSWRLVKCEVVPPASQGWRQGAYLPSAGRGTRVPAVLRLDGMVLTVTPTKRSVSPHLTHVWCAGAPGPGAVVSEPGGARPFRLALYKGPVGPTEPAGHRVPEAEASSAVHVDK